MRPNRVAFPESQRLTSQEALIAHQWLTLHIDMALGLSLGTIQFRQTSAFDHSIALKIPTGHGQRAFQGTFLPESTKLVRKN